MKKNRTKRIMSLLLTLCMVTLLLVPTKVFGAGTYTLTIVNGTVMATGETVVDLGEGIGVVVTANEAPAGKVFDKWVTVDGVGIDDSSRSFTWIQMPAKNATITATYKNLPETDTELKQLKVNTRTASSTWESFALNPKFEKATRNYTLNLTENYNNIYFYLSEEVVGQSATATVDGVALTVTEALNGFETEQHALNKAQTVFVFSIKSKDESKTENYTVTVNRGSGIFSPVTVTGGTTAEPSYAESDVVTITANAPEIGKVFDKWTTSDGVTFANVNNATTTFTMPANAVSVTATYKDAPAATYAVTVNSGTGGGSFAEGSTVIINANAPATGKVFDKWTTTDAGVSFDDSEESQTRFSMPAHAVSVTATYKDAPAATYAVTVNSGTGSGSFAEGATVNITASALATGKMFDKWTTTDGVTFANANMATTTFTMLAKAVTVTATYKDAPAATYAVTVNSGTGGGSFAEGATVNITASDPATGKLFDKWTTTDGVTFANENNATTTFTMPANAVTVTATYKDAPPATYAVTVNSGTGGGSFAEGATVNITANAPATGKVFDKWTTTDAGVSFDDSEESQTRFSMPAHAVSVTATYKDAPPATYAVTVNSGTGGGSFAEGATVNITANAPATGKLFDKWITTDAGVSFDDSEESQTRFTMPANAVTVIATYKDIPPETPDYKIIDGENGTWNKGKTTGMVITSNGNYDDFTGVSVDDNLIDASNYTVAAGSTIVTLKPAYLETLTEGTHLITLKFGNYSVQTNLTILAANEEADESNTGEIKDDTRIPQTGVNYHTLLFSGLMILSGSAIIVITYNKKKKRSYNK